MSDSFFGIVHLPTYLIGTVLVILLPGGAVTQADAAPRRCAEHEQRIRARQQNDQHGADDIGR